MNETMIALLKIALYTLLMMVLGFGMAIVLTKSTALVAEVPLWVFVTVFFSIYFSTLFFLAYFKKKPFKSELVEEIYKKRLMYKTDGEFATRRKDWVIDLFNVEIEHDKIVKKKADIKLNTTAEKKLLPEKSTSSEGNK